MSFLKLVVSFAPWITFLIIAKDTMPADEPAPTPRVGLSHNELRSARRRVGLGGSPHTSTVNGRGVAVAGIVGAAAVAALVLVPGLRLGVDQPLLGAVVILVPTTALLAATGSRHYGLGRAVAVALVVTLVAGGVSWLVAVFTLVKAISGVGVGLPWAILLFVTPAVSVLALGALALRVVPPRCSDDGLDG